MIEQQNNNQKVLNNFFIDLTTLAEQGKLDPVIGRDEEIRRTIQVLQRRTKNNPILIGDPGVGKTAIVEGLSQRIINKEIPEGLKNSRILSLDVGLLLSGIKYRGEFEERVKKILCEIKKNKFNIILFIDEVHTIVGNGISDGVMDISNMLKPSLARGELHCIGATTLYEYKKFIEKDIALERRFQKILINEPSINTTIAILRGLKARYELHHNVQITDSAIISATLLSHRYITDRKLPDKAIDLIDESASNIRIQIDSKPEELDRLERKIIQLKLEKQALLKESDNNSIEKLEILNNELSKKEIIFFDLENKWKNEKVILLKIQNIKFEIEKVKVQIEKFRRLGNLEKVSELQYGVLLNLENQKNLLLCSNNNKNNVNNLLYNRVTNIEVAEIVSKWTGIPVSSVLEGEKQKLLSMENILCKKIIGQEEAITVISNAIRRNRVGLSDPHRPIGSFIFAGSTGVGKTELCKLLSLFLFSSKNSILRIDMSEFMEKHSVSRLLGAPPGYIGYEEGGYLTEYVRRRPYSLILLDEIEKAHKDIFNVLLQVLDEGRLTDRQGNTVNFCNTVIIMTSNLGLNIIQKKFNEITYLEMKDIILKEINAFFNLEFINRVDEIIVFKQLDKVHIINIMKLQLEDLSMRLKEKGYNIQITDSVLQYLWNKGYNIIYGARPIKRIIQQEIENLLSQKILSEELSKNQLILLDVLNNKLHVSY